MRTFRLSRLISEHRVWSRGFGGSSYWTDPKWKKLPLDSSTQKRYRYLRRIRSLRKVDNSVKTIKGALPSQFIA